MDLLRIRERAVIAKCSCHYLKIYYGVDSGSCVDSIKYARVGVKRCSLVKSLSTIATHGLVKVMSENNHRQNTQRDTSRAWAYDRITR